MFALHLLRLLDTFNVNGRRPTSTDENTHQINGRYMLEIGLGIMYHTICNFMQLFAEVDRIWTSTSLFNDRKTWITILIITTSIWDAPPLHTRTHTESLNFLLSCNIFLCSTYDLWTMTYLFISLLIVILLTRLYAQWVQNPFLFCSLFSSLHF